MKPCSECGVEVDCKHRNQEELRSLERPTEDKSVVFTFDVNGEHEEILKISKDGFYYRGERVDDINNVYERFTQWLDQAEVRKAGE